MPFTINREVLHPFGANNRVHLVRPGEDHTLCGRPTAQFQPLTKIDARDDDADAICCGTCRRIAFARYTGVVTPLDAPNTQAKDS
jgi:hypothetical protein